MKKKMTKQEISWMLYDAGNSAYSMAITSALFPVYFGMFKGADKMALGYFNSLASLLIALLSPILGTIADYKGYKKRFFLFFFLLGVVFTSALTVVPKDAWVFLAIIYIITSIGFSGANIFYDAFLVDVTTNDKMDEVSTKGFAYGYIASVVPFAISLATIYYIGFDEFLGYQIAFLITALWWALFTVPFIKNVKQVYGVAPEPKPISNSFKRLAETFRKIKMHRVVFMFIIAYFLYIDGVDTIIKMSVPYATSILGSEAENVYMLLGMLLLVQIVAFPFAIMYGKLAGKFGAKKMISVGILTYVFATIFGFFMSQIWHLFVLGFLIGSAQGGIQALSRSYFARIIPKDNANEFFGFYNVFGKFAAIIGPFLMAATADLVGNITGDPIISARFSILAIIPLFILGLVLFLRLPDEKKIQ